MSEHEDELTVLWPGMMFETDANLKLLSPPLDNQINDDSSWEA